MITGGGGDIVLFDRGDGNDTISGDVADIIRISPVEQVDFEAGEAR